MDYRRSRSIGMMCPECGKYIETETPDPDREIVIKCDGCSVLFQYATMNGRWYKVSVPD